MDDRATDHRAKTGSDAEDASARRPCVVGIGASAGGLEAIREMLGPARAEDPFAYVVIQHLDPNHESLLAELVGRYTALSVRQASGGEKVEAGTVYIIPPGHGLAIEGGVLSLTDFSQPRGMRRPIDDFFESLATDQGRRAACVILSGTGGDGSTGLRAIKEHGGLCIAQDPATARYDGMPTAATATGMVDFVRAPNDIVECIQQFFERGVGEDETLAKGIETTLDEICAALDRMVGHDFSGYKKSTLMRRIERRIQVLSIGDARAYLDRVRTDRAEAETLLRDLLINVTRFFRDPEHFAVLRKQVIDPMVQHAGDRELRIWVPGCSSGEEAYTIAMLAFDSVRTQRKSVRLQIIATDIDEQMLRFARQAIYPVAALADIPEDLRDAYTIGRDGTFQISSQVRDTVRFSSHSVIKDPPFSNLDLVSCRNLLIYFGDHLQATALSTFHYALNPGGVLFLGPSESLGRFENFFTPLDQRARIFRRNDTQKTYPIELRHQRPWHTRDIDPAEPSGRHRIDWRRGLAEDRILRAYAPPTIQVSATGEILATTGSMTKYLSVDPLATGPLYVQTLARPGLAEPLSAMVRQVATERRRAIARDLTSELDLGRQKLDVVADVLGDGTILLVFRDRDRFEPMGDEDMVEVRASDSHVQQLEEELRATRSRLFTAVEELETANEELKSSNEEMMSMNEELQSTNEELATVNDELKSKVDQLSVANSDLQNFFRSTSLAIVVVDGNLLIRNYTDAVRSIFPLRAGDRGRSLSEVKGNLDDDGDHLDLARRVIETGEAAMSTVGDDAGRTWSLVISPYRTSDGRTEGATLIFHDLTDALRLEAALSEGGRRLMLALEVAGLGILEIDLRRGRIDLDERAQGLLGLEEGEQASLSPILDAIDVADRSQVESALRTGSATEGRVVDIVFQLNRVTGRSTRSLRLLGRRVGSASQPRLLAVILDVTAEQEAAKIRDLMLREMNHRVKNLFSIIGGILRIAGRRAESVADLVGNVETRIAALARSHDLTQRKGTDSALLLGDLISAALEPYRDHASVELNGPDLQVLPRELTPLSLLFHEWATNASKHGVLGSSRLGRLNVSWNQETDGGVTIEWEEVWNVPPDETETAVNTPGFGTTLVEISAAQLGGSLTVSAIPGRRTMRLSYGGTDG